MFSRPAEPRSIASQLVLLFTLAAGLLLCCGLGVLYWIFVQHAFEEDNEVLADKVLALRADLMTASDPKTLDEALKNQQAGRARVVYWVRLVDSEGGSVAETPGMNALLPASLFPPPQSANPSVGSPTDYRKGGKYFALVATVEEVRGQSYMMQVAQDRSGDEEFVKEFGALLAVVLTLGILASTVIAITVTKRGLRPLAKMAR